MPLTNTAVLIANGRVTVKRGKVRPALVLELAELVKSMEDKFGIQAAAPMAMGAAVAAVAAPVEEKTSFDVILKEAGANKINVIAITGTKGKSSTAEILNAVLEAAGKKTALSSTIHFKIGDETIFGLWFFAR